MTTPLENTNGAAVPVGLSFARTSQTTSTQAEGHPRRNTGGNDSCLAVPGSSRGATRTPQPTGDTRTPKTSQRRQGRGIGHVRLHGLASSLSARDHLVLELLDEHRFLTTIHLFIMLFEDKHANEGTGLRVCRRVLARLHRHRLIDQLPRRVGGYGAGSAAGVWFLTPTGHRVLRLTRGEGSTLPPARVREPSTRFVAHTLAIADTRVRLHQAARAGAFGITRVETEPSCWRPYLGLHGVREILKPDLALTTTSPDGHYEDSWLLEVDLGTEHLPTVLAKCSQYETYRRTGTEQERRGVFPVVVWITLSQARADTLRAAIHRTRALDQTLFRVITPDQLTDLIAGGAQ